MVRVLLVALLLLTAPEALAQDSAPALDPSTWETWPSASTSRKKRSTTSKRTRQTTTRKPSTKRRVKKKKTPSSKSSTSDRKKTSRRRKAPPPPVEDDDWDTPWDSDADDADTQKQPLNDEDDLGTAASGAERPGDRTGDGRTTPPDEGGARSRPGEADLFGTQERPPPTGESAPGRLSEDDLFGTSGGEPPSAPGATGRPDEAELFGGGPSPAAGPSEPPAASAAESVREGGLTQEEEGLTAGIRDRFLEGDIKEDPLVIGGLFYQRFSGTNREGVGLATTTFTAPTLVDGYFDARPNDRLRAMIVARLLYDPMFNEAAFMSQALGERPDNPSISLDQLWLRFDVLRTVFVTVGRQHVKWGTGRFWNPTDYLHPVRRDALALFDARLGTNLIKLHLPIESNGANFYALAVLDSFSAENALGNVGGALRAEWVLGQTEFGLDGLVQRGRTPRYGFDVSSAIGPFDVYGELAYRSGRFSRWVENRTEPVGPTGPIPGWQPYVREAQEGLDWSTTVGANWTFAYTENDTATVGGEYFYNEPGYSDPSIYPWLLFNGDFQPFYTGKHYAALYALVQGPGSWDDTSFVLSNLANLSDRSYVTRFDYTVRVLTHLTVEANVSVFYGTPKGEFRLELELPATGTTPPVTVPAQRFMMGMGLRLDI